MFLFTVTWLLLGITSVTWDGLAPTVGRLGGGRRACVYIVVGREVRRGRTANSVGGGMMLLA